MLIDLNGCVFNRAYLLIKHFKVIQCFPKKQIVNLRFLKAQCSLISLWFQNLFLSFKPLPNYLKHVTMCLSKIKIKDIIYSLLFNPSIAIPKTI